MGFLSQNWSCSTVITMTFSSKYLIHISFIFFLNVVLVASEAARPLPPGLYLKTDLYSLYCGHQTFSTSVMFFFPPYYMQIHQTASFLFPPSSHKGLVYFYNSILLLQFHLTTSCHVRYVSDVAIRSCPFLCMIHISEPPIQLLVVLGEFRFLST